jgi:aminopeptidase N
LARATCESRYQADALVLDMLSSLKAVIGGPGAVTRVRALMQHPKFTLLNPNRARSVIGAFSSGNPRGFHAGDGTGYDLVTEVIGAIDERNPQIAARLATAFRSWRMLEAGRRGKAEAALRRLAASGPLSRDLTDILDRSLAE